MSAPRRRRRSPAFRQWQVERQERLQRRLARSRVALFLGCVLMAASGAGYHVLPRTAQGEDGPQPIAHVPPDDPDRGLVYDGLVPAKRGAPCVGGYEVAGPTNCSHGPDEPPPGLAVKKAVAPVAPGAPAEPLPSWDTAAEPREADVARDAGSVAPADTTPAVIPDATPEAAAFSVGANGIACDGDGQAGKRVQVLYAYEAGTASRYGQYLASFRTWAAGVDAIYAASARETGGSRHIRYLTTPACDVDVAEVELPGGALAAFDRTIGALKTLGFNKSDRKYMIFADAKVYCGIGTFARDERTGAANRSNGGPSYGRSDSGCWNAGVAAHELGHNLGAVNNGAPNSSQAGHCVDEYDVMCYRDSSGNPTRVVCTDHAHDQRLDCNHDDYYHTNPSPGSYIATHWNVADNEFLISGGTGDGPGPTPTPTRAATPPPSPSRSTIPAPSVTRTSAPTAPPSPTFGPRTPIPSPAVGTPVLQVSEVTATSARLAWDAAAPGTRYAVQLGGRMLCLVTVTAVRLVGLRPETVYTVQISIQRANGSLVPHTMPVQFQTGPAVMPVPGSWLTLTNALTGGAADVFGARSANGTPVVLYRRHDGANQRWQLQVAGTGAFQLRSASSGKCLTTTAGALRPGTPLVQYTCDAANTAQRWRLMPTAYGFAVASAGANLVIGAGGTRYYGYRALVLQTPNQLRYQSWTAA